MSMNVFLTNFKGHNKPLSNVKHGFYPGTSVLVTVLETFIYALFHILSFHLRLPSE